MIKENKLRTDNRKIRKERKVINLRMDFHGIMMKDNKIVKNKDKGSYQ